jgi:ubiquitin-activating enzyme E1-like protein
MSNPELDSFQAIPCSQFNPASLTTSFLPVFPVASSGTITGATQAFPVSITSVAHGLVTGQTVTIINVVGMTQLNGNSYIITVTGANTFTLNGVNGTAYGAYISGGVWNTYGGFPDNIKIMTIYNGAAVAMDYSFDGIIQAGTWPAGATLVIDLQTNHSDHPPYGSGTLYGRAGQNIWVRTSVNPTYLTVGGFR